MIRWVRQLYGEPVPTRARVTMALVSLIAVAAAILDVIYVSPPGLKATLFGIIFVFQVAGHVAVLALMRQRKSR